MKPYRVGLIQQETQVIVDPKDREAVIDKNLSRIFELLEWTVLRLGEVRLAAVSEYSVIGQYRPRTLEQWIELAETIPGPVTERMGEQARRFGCYLAGNLYERDPKWPGRLFNTSFIVDPNGEVILKYRKNNGPNNLNNVYTGPGDVYSEYVEKHGEMSMFPVVDTPIGTLGCLTCTDIVFPEMARALALQGAEILIHPTAEPYSDVDRQWDVLRQARAYENMAYLLSINAGAFLGSNRPVGGYRGHSQVVNHRGEVISAAAGSGEAVCVAEIDLDAVREARTAMTDTGHVWNFLAELRSDLYVPVYQQAKRWPNDGWAQKKLSSTKEARQLAREIIERLVAEGKLKRPES